MLLVPMFLMLGTQATLVHEDKRHKHPFLSSAPSVTSLMATACWLGHWGVLEIQLIQSFLTPPWVTTGGKKKSDHDCFLSSSTRLPKTSADPWLTFRAWCLECAGLILDPGCSTGGKWRWHHTHLLRPLSQGSTMQAMLLIEWHSPPPPPPPNDRGNVPVRNLIWQVRVAPPLLPPAPAACLKGDAWWRRAWQLKLQR